MFLFIAMDGMYAANLSGTGAVIASYVYMPQAVAAKVKLMSRLPLPKPVTS